jgi:hypothetical protein
MEVEDLNGTYSFRKCEFLDNVAAVGGGVAVLGPNMNFETCIEEIPGGSITILNLSTGFDDRTMRIAFADCLFRGNSAEYVFTYGAISDNIAVVNSTAFVFCGSPPSNDCIGDKSFPLELTDQCQIGPPTQCLTPQPSPSPLVRRVLPIGRK